MTQVTLTGFDVLQEQLGARCTDHLGGSATLCQLCRVAAADLLNYFGTVDVGQMESTGIAASCLHP